jgi:hypothetical protein
MKGMYERSSKQVQQLEMEVEALSLKLVGLQGSNEGSGSESLHSQLNAASDREKALIDSKLGIEKDICIVCAYVYIYLFICMYSNINMNINI